MCRNRRSQPVFWLSVLTLLVYLFIPVISHAIQSISPTTLVKGRNNAVTLTMEPHEFDAGGNIVNFQVWLEDGSPVSVWALVPQFVDEVTVFVAIPATATGTGFVGHAGCTDYSLLPFHTDPFTCGGNNPMFTLTAYDPGNPPPPMGANIVTDVSPTKLPRGHKMTLQLSYDVITWPYMEVGLQYQSGGSWTTASIHHNWYDSASGEFWCNTSPCAIDVEIPADADLGTAYLYNLYDGSGGTGPKVPVTIIDWPPLTLTGIAPDTTQGGVNSVTVTLNGSGFQNGDVYVMGGSWTMYDSAVLSDTQIRATVPAPDLTTPEDVHIWVGSSSYGYQTDPVALHLVLSGGPIPGLSIDRLAPTRAAAGKCASMTATTQLPFAAWGPSPFLAYTYLVLTGTEENPGPTETATGAIPLTADMFSPVEGNPTSYQIDFQLCLPDTAASGQGLLAPGMLVGGQPTAWAYPGVAYDVVRLFNAAFVGFTDLSPSGIRRGQEMEVILQPTPPELMDGATAMAEFHYTVGGVPQTRTGVVHCGYASCNTTITLPSSADLGPGYVLNPDAVGTFPGLVAPFTVTDGMKIVSITPGSVAPGSPDTTVTLTVSGYDPAVTDLWIYTPLEDTWYLVGTDTGSFEVIDSTTVHMTIPASLLASPTTLTVELYNNDTSEYSDKDLPVKAASTSASMILGELQQSGNQVVAPISWSGPVDNPTVECGTTPPQQHSGASVTCVYSTPGAYSVTGTYGSGQTADPLAVEIPSLALQNGDMTITIQGTPRASFTAYSFPVPVDLAATFTIEDGIGIPDSLDLGQTTLSATPDAGPGITAAVSAQNGLTYGGRLHLSAAGTYTLALNGQTLAGHAISTSRTFTVSGGRITLTAGPLAQAGSAVTLPVHWPTEALTLTDHVVDCDTSNGQAFTGTAGQCVFTRPGTYTLRGRFTDTLGTLGVHTDPMIITVPAVAGTPTLRATNANGHVPTHDLSGSIPVATYGPPTVYPVPVQVNLTLGPPTTGQVGIADSLDRSQTTIYVKPVSTAADRTAPATAGDTALSVHDSGDGSTFQSSASLTVFPPKPDDPSRWQYRLIVDGQTETGLPVKTEMYIEGPFGDPNLISYTTWQRVDPIYPYAPATFRYMMAGLKSGITGEPMTQNWSSSEGETKSQTAPDGYFDALFLSSGAKTVTLAGSGPLSGTKPFVDHPAVPSASPATIAFTITAPSKNRPPAQYRFAPNYPPLLPGEKLVGSPNWAIDGTTVGTGNPFYYTFTAAGSHEMVVSQATTTRTLYGRTAVTVNPNQPPTGSVDCSGSSIVKTTNPWSYTLSCKALNAVDADGRITSMVWALPDLGVSKSGSTYWNYGLPTAQAVRVQLILTDDSGASTTLENTVDLRTLR